nr:META domain-containing protein [Arthrobacter sp. ISL-30]
MEPGSLTVQLSSVNDSLQLAVKTPCNPISGRVSINGSTLTAERLATGAMGCIGEQSEQEKWVLDFLARQVEMTFSQNTLNWKSGPDMLSFKIK